MGTSLPIAGLAVLVVMLAVNVWVHVGPRATHLLTGPLAASLLLLVGTAAGLSREDLGLDPQALRQGLLWGAAPAAAVVTVLAAGVAVPASRRLFRDERYRLPAAQALVTALVVVPLATVVFEEVAFRGVLWALVEREHGAVAATIGSALLFGAWHVLPGLALLRSNPAVATSTGRRRAHLTLLGVICFTAASGVVFAELRRRSGSLLAPVVMHWAVNAGAVLAAAAAWRLSRETATPRG